MNTKDLLSNRHPRLAKNDTGDKLEMRDLRHYTEWHWLVNGHAKLTFEWHSYAEKSQHLKKPNYTTIGAIQCARGITDTLKECNSAPILSL
jgi:hypothetical protein